MRPATNGRAHLSIGEVLSLLQEEFPDVTISKIRFLESQGLLDPERTPSGYRKFYNGDIERLRWILRQQKDHYLPLKVIKDKLDQAGGEIPPDDDEELPSEGQQRLPTSGGEHRPGNARASSRQRSQVSTRNGSPVASNAGSNAQRDDAASAQPQPGPPQRWMDSSWPEEPPLDVNGVSRPQVLPAPPPPPGPPLSRTRRSSVSDPVADAPLREAEVDGLDARGRARRAGDRTEPSNPPPRRPSRPRSTTGAGPERTGSAPVPPTVPPASSGPGPPAAAGVSDVSLTIDELAEASGLSVRDIRDLERFGLVERLDGDGAAVYDGDALVVAHTAAGFLQHGIEARHLRTYKVAMEREAGLFEQIVLPVLKQRNPEARQRAARTVTELIRLGEVMRGVLLRRELRDHLGGG